MKLEFTLEQLGVLDKALQQLPYFVAAPLIASINQQLEAQRKIMDAPLPDLKPIKEELIFPKTHQQNGE